MFADYPALINTIHQRSATYNETLKFIANPPADCKIQIIAPPADFPVKRLTMNKARLIKGYRMGRQCAQQYFSQYTRAA